MRLRLSLVLAVALGVILVQTGFSALHTGRSPQAADTSTKILHRYHKIVKGYHKGHGAEYWHWQYQLEKRANKSFTKRYDQLVRWYKRNYGPMGYPPHYQQWLCIHKGEGAWNDPNAPYYGGLQMDLQFQRTYGWNLLQRKGTADNWTPLEQMWVAERAWVTRGFYPWPTTARNCGLI